jgi:phenylacetate-coenzyme A ligase PaaK-like adenylate-forming protein
MSLFKATHRQRTALRQRIEALDTRSTPAEWERLALDVFAYQYEHNDLYRQYCTLIGQNKEKIQTFTQIPFLPIQLFKNYDIRTDAWQAQTTFLSSGTTGNVNSQHHVRDLQWYRHLARRGFESVYGQVSKYCVLGLLPSYLERGGSSLIFMVDDFIRQSHCRESGFFLDDTTRLWQILQRLQRENVPTLLIGVSFALLDLAEKFGDTEYSLGNTIVMETGGMKGRRREVTRQELHQTLQEAFKIPQIHSEYGMTELFSQAYAPQNGIFKPAPTLQAFARSINDPLALMPSNGKLGVLNMMDLGNLDTIAFVATDDLGRVHADGTFEVLGRLDHSDIRGCNLLVAE